MKLCGNCAIPQNLRTRKLGEIPVFYAMVGIKLVNFCTFLRENIVPMFMSFHEKKSELFYNLLIYMATF